VHTRSENSGYDYAKAQNTVNDEADATISVRLFHSFGPAEANDRSATVTRRDGQTVSWLEVDELLLLTVAL